MATLRFMIHCAAFVLGSTFIAASIPIPVMDVAGLVEKADTIIIGQVISVVEKGTQTMEINGKATLVHAMAGEVHVDQTLKGLTQSPTLIFHFSWPDEPLGYTGVARNTYRIVFLTKTSSGYAFASPYYPSIVAMPGVTLRDVSTLENIIYQLAAVLSSNLIPEQKREALYVLQTIRIPAATEILERVLDDKNVELRLIADAALLERNNLGGLQIAEVALTNRPPQLPNYLFHNLNYAIAQGVRDQRSVPVLNRLLQVSDVETRRAAASALWHIASHSAVPGLVRALNDQDFEVRYYAVIGLAEITGQLDWHPNEEIFRAEEVKYLQHWRQWAQMNYPSS